MSIGRASQKNCLKPRRGGMGLPAAVHAAPTGLDRVVGWALLQTCRPYGAWCRLACVRAGPTNSLERTRVRQPPRLLFAVALEDSTLPGFVGCLCPAAAAQLFVKQRRT